MPRVAGYGSFLWVWDGLARPDFRMGILHQVLGVRQCYFSLLDSDGNGRGSCTATTLKIEWFYLGPYGEIPGDIDFL